MRNRATKAECFREIKFILDQIDESTIQHNNQLATFDYLKNFCEEEAESIKVKQDRQTQKILAKRATEGDKMREYIYSLLEEKRYKPTPTILQEIIEEYPDATYSKISRRLSDLFKMGRVERKSVVYEDEDKHNKRILGYRIAKEQIEE